MKFSSHPCGNINVIFRCLKMKAKKSCCRILSVSETATTARWKMSFTAMKKCCGQDLRMQGFSMTKTGNTPLNFIWEKLKSVIFQEELGTVYDKTVRVAKLAKEIAALLDVSKEDMEAIERAASISKFDLVTNMVNEFPELQGVIGEKYAFYYNGKRNRRPDDENITNRFTRTIRFLVRSLHPSSVSPTNSIPSSAQFQSV